MRELELRARETGGEWTEWVETANGDPVYFGGADELQLRTHGWRPAGTLHYVNVSGTTSGAESLLDQVPRGPQLGLHQRDRDRSTPKPTRRRCMPEIVRRAAWGATRRAAAARRATGPAYGTGEGGGRPSHRQRRRLQRVGGAIDRPRDLPLPPQRERLERHRLQRPRRPLRDALPGSGGRPAKAVVGAHAQGFNAKTTSIASIGTHTTLADHAGDASGDRRLPGLEDDRARDPGHGQDDADVGRRRG